MNDAKTIEDLRQRAAALRAQGSAGPASELDDLADRMQRSGVDVALKQAATVQRKKGRPDKAKKLEQLAAAAPNSGPGTGAIAAAFAGGIGILALSRRRR
jgi:hypothetical protein